MWNKFLYKLYLIIIIEKNLYVLNWSQSLISIMSNLDLLHLWLGIKYKKDKLSIMINMRKHFNIYSIKFRTFLAQNKTSKTLILLSPKWKIPPLFSYYNSKLTLPPQIYSFNTKQMNLDLKKLGPLESGIYQFIT